LEFIQSYFSRFLDEINGTLKIFLFMVKFY